MPNMSMTKVPVPEQDPNVRNHNFQEVCLGYTKEHGHGGGHPLPQLQEQALRGRAAR